MLVRKVMVTQSKDSFVLVLSHIAPVLFFVICTRYQDIIILLHTHIVLYTIYALSVWSHRLEST
jgi:hypothetical protein